MKNIKQYEKLQSELSEVLRNITAKAYEIGKGLNIEGYLYFENESANEIDISYGEVWLMRPDDDQSGDKLYLIVPIEYFSMSEETLQKEYVKHAEQEAKDLLDYETNKKIKLKKALELQIENARKQLESL